MSDKDIQRKVGMLGAAMVYDGKDPVETGIKMAVLAQTLEADKKRREEREQRNKQKRR